MKNQNRSYIYALITVLLWSTVATAFKIALRNLNYIQLLLVANATSQVVFFMIIVLQRKIGDLRHTTYKDLAFSALQGLLNPFAYYLILFKVYSILPAQVAQPTNFIWPIVLMLLSAVILKQRIQLMGIVALIISFAGVLILATQGNLSTFRVAQPFGIALSMVTSVIWSLFWILNMKDKRNDEIKLLLSFSFSLCYVLVLSGFTGNLTNLSMSSLMPAVYIGLAEMGISFILWLKALQLSESTGKVANLIYITPFISMIIIHLVLKENLYYTSVIGLILIIGGIFIGQIKSKRT